MGLIAFAGRKIGFWLAERSQDPLAEVPAGLVPQVVGARGDDTRAVVLVGTDETGVPLWAHVLHSATGAALVCPFGERLFIAHGERSILIDGEGVTLARYDAPGDDLLGAWPTDGALLVLGRRAAHLLGPDLGARWVAPLEGEAFHFLGSDGDALTLVAAAGDDWRHVRLALATGAALA